MKGSKKSCRTGISAKTTIDDTHTQRPTAQLEPGVGENILAMD